MNFCRREGILVQGRGSAANSAVCYSLGITAVDPVGMDLLFERFLSEERGEWPDIDLDLPSGDRRERVIQHVYERYGARGAAMTANVITYRDRSASREIGKVLGIPLDGDRPALAAHAPLRVRRPGRHAASAASAEAGFDRDDRRVRALRPALRRDPGPAAAPRPALGRHGDRAGAARRASCRSSPPRMPGRVVVQWDKDDCADLGIIKVDLLGLGMMSALQDCARAARRTRASRSTSPTCRRTTRRSTRCCSKADTVGLFQVESRAQMATLPRLKPDHFYDLVVEVAIIRPGPIVGKMVHPYLNRRTGARAGRRTRTRRSSRS